MWCVKVSSRRQNVISGGMEPTLSFPSVFFIISDNDLTLLDICCVQSKLKEHIFRLKFKQCKYKYLLVRLIAMF